VPVFTDFKLHDITDPEDERAAEPLDMNQNVWSPKFVLGNRRFLTKRLWGCANEPPYFHHGLFTTLRQSVLAHAGEALASRQAFQSLRDYDRDSVIEFLKSLQVLAPGTSELVVDEKGRKRQWSMVSNPAIGPLSSPRSLPVLVGPTGSPASPAALVPTHRWNPN